MLAHAKPRQGYPRLCLQLSGFNLQFALPTFHAPASHHLLVQAVAGGTPCANSSGSSSTPLSSGSSGVWAPCTVRTPCTARLPLSLGARCTLLPPKDRCSCMGMQRQCQGAQCSMEEDELTRSLNRFFLSITSSQLSMLAGTSANPHQFPSQLSMPACTPPSFTCHASKITS